MKTTRQLPSCSVSRQRALSVLFTEPFVRKLDPEPTRRYLRDLFFDQAAFDRHLNTLVDLEQGSKLPHHPLTEEQKAEIIRQELIVQQEMDFSKLNVDELHRLLFDRVGLQDLKKLQESEAFDPETLCEEARQELGASSICLYVADPFCPDDFRIVCMPGVALPEMMYGSIGLPAESSKRLITDGENEQYITDVRDNDGLSSELSTILAQHPKENRRLFANFVQREGVHSRARLAHRVQGQTQLALFVNYSTQTAFDSVKQARIRQLFHQLVEQLPVMMHRLKMVNPALAQQIVRIWEPSRQLTQIGLKGEGGRSLQVCLNSILDAALDAFGIRKTGIGTIHLYDRETHTLRLVAFRGHIDRLDDAWVQSVRETDRPGVITIVALKGKSILIEDLTKSPYGAIHRCIRDGTRSELAVPMLADGVVVGVISLESTQPGAFTSDSLRVLWNAANEAALAVLLDREKTAHREKEQLLNRFLQFHNRAATSHLGAPLPLAELAAIACETLDASMCDLWQYNPKTEEFDTAGFSHPNRSRTPGPRKNGWSAYLQRTGWPIWITRVKQDDQFDVLYWDPQAQAWQSSPPTDDSPQTVSPHLRELGVQCELGIPILVHQQCIGVAWLKYQDDMVQEPSITNLEQAAGFVGAAALVLYRNGKGPLFIPSQTRMSLVEEFTGKVAQLMQAHFEG